MTSDMPVPSPTWLVAKQEDSIEDVDDLCKASTPSKVKVQRQSVNEEPSRVVSLDSNIRSIAPQKVSLAAAVKSHLQPVGRLSRQATSAIKTDLKAEVTGKDNRNDMVDVKEVWEVTEMIIQFTEEETKAELKEDMMTECAMQTKVDKEVKQDDTDSQDNTRICSPALPRRQHISPSEMKDILGTDHDEALRLDDLRKMMPDSRQRLALEAQISELSHSIFSEDSVEHMYQQQDWKMMVAHRGPHLQGFLVLRRFGPPLRLLVVTRLAVVPAARMQGIGRRLMRWATAYAQQLPTAECTRLGVSSFLEAEGFYSRMGFTKGEYAHVGWLERACRNEESIPSRQQVWMERRFEGRGRSRSSGPTLRA